MKKSIIKIGVFLLLASFICSFMFIGCKKQETAETTAAQTTAETTATESGKKWENVTINVQMFSGPEAEAMQPTVDYWNQNYADKTGITVNNLALSRTGYFEKIQSQLMSGATDPDIVHPFSQSSAKLAPYLEVLNPYFENNELFSGPNGEQYDFNDLLPSALNTTKTLDGSIVLVPKDQSEVIFYWRTDLLDVCPDTWDGIVDVAKQFEGKDGMHGFGYQGKYEMWNFCSFLAVAWSYGAEMFDANGNPTFNTPEWVNAFKFLEKIAAFDGFQPGVENAEYPEIFASIQNGEVPIGYEWNAAYRELTSPEISPKVGGKLDIAPPAKATPDGKNSMYVQTICFAINKSSKNKDAAFKFLSWASFGEGAKLYEEAGGSSPLKSIWSTAAEPLPTILNWAEFGQAVPAYEFISDVIMIGSSWTQKVIIKQVTAEQAAEGMQKEVENFLSAR